MIGTTMLNKGDNLHIGNASGPATINQANGNINTEHHYHIGLQIADVIPLVHDLVKSDLNIYKIQAEQTATCRLEEFAKSFEKEIIDKVADKIDRFAEPSIQFATREAAVGYIKSGSSDEKESLIDLLIERVKEEEHTSMQHLIDDAIRIIPKLSRKNVAILTLLTYSKLSLTGTKKSLDEWVSCMNPVINDLQDVSPLDIEYLVQADCVTPLIGFSQGSNWITRNRENYPLAFTHPINAEEAKRFFNEAGINCTTPGQYTFPRSIGVDKLLKLFSILSFNNDGTLSPLLLHHNQISEALKDLDFIDKTSFVTLFSKSEKMSDNEILKYYESFNSNWSAAINILNGKCNEFVLKPVGAYIGARQLARLSKRNVPLSLFYK